MYYVYIYMTSHKRPRYHLCPPPGNCAHELRARTAHSFVTPFLLCARPLCVPGSLVPQLDARLQKKLADQRRQKQIQERKVLYTHTHTHTRAHTHTHTHTHTHSHTRTHTHTPQDSRDERRAEYAKAGMSNTARIMATRGP
jgi:hypothetical protein